MKFFPTASTLFSHFVAAKDDSPRMKLEARVAELAVECFSECCILATSSYATSLPDFIRLLLGGYPFAGTAFTKSFTPQTFDLQPITRTKRQSSDDWRC